MASFVRLYSKRYFEKFYRQYPEGFIVAEAKGGIAGYIIGRPKQDIGQIISLAVASVWQRKAVGRALVDYLVEHFRKSGLKKIILHARTNNQTAVSFFQKLNFEISQTIEGYYSNGDNAYLMERQI